VGRGTLPSINIDIRRSLSLYANIVHSINIPGIASRHSGVDIVIIRENTEGEYSGMEHEVAPGVTESLKVMTRDATRRIAAYAFEYAHMNNRAKVTAVHKANIMKKADGIFLESCADVAKAWPHIQYEEVIVDNCMMQLVSKPQQFDVMVTPNFYGSLVSNAVAGLMGGPGVAPGVSLGAQGALFEQGARHVGMDIRGKDVANPSSILFASVMLLRYLKMPNFADRMEAAIFATCVRGARGALARDTLAVDTLQISVRADSLGAVRQELQRLADMMQPVDTALAQSLRTFAGDRIAGDASLSGYLYGSLGKADAIAALGARALAYQGNVQCRGNRIRLVLRETRGCQAERHASAPRTPALPRSNVSFF
jgi:NAD-dependent isocitrate dehydrogenase